MIINLVWSTDKRTYHESVRGNTIPKHPGNAGVKASKKIQRILGSQHYREVIAFVDGIAISGCNCNMRPPIEGSRSYHAWHNDATAQTLQEYDVDNSVHILQFETSGVTSELLAMLDQEVRQFLVAHMRKGRML